MRRRTFLGATASAALAQTGRVPIIDTHIHLFDTSRPQGVPWPPKDNSVLYHSALPPRLRSIAAPLGIVGAIEVECSPWLEDNQWVLDVAAKDPFIVGTIGNLEPGKPEFGKQLERFHRNPLFRGIRYGNLWGRDLGAEIRRPAFVADLKLLAEASLVLDSANPDPALVSALLATAAAVPTLRIVFDHLAQLTPLPDTVRELGQCPNVNVKISQVLRRVNGRVPEDLNFYRSQIDTLFGIFGEDRVLYGSDWPNSDQWAPYPKILGVVREYFTAKGRAIAGKYFWRNSLKVYRWVKRSEDQPA